MNDPELKEISDLLSEDHDPEEDNYWAILVGRRLVATIEGLENKISYLQKLENFNKHGGWKK